MICTTSSPPLHSSPPTLTLEKLDNEGNDIVIWSPPTPGNLSMDPIQWSVGEVAVWVENILGFEDAMLSSTLFRNASIDGRALLSMVRVSVAVLNNIKGV